MHCSFNWNIKTLNLSPKCKKHVTNSHHSLTALRLVHHWYLNLARPLKLVFVLLIHEPFSILHLVWLSLFFYAPKIKIGIEIWCWWCKSRKQINIQVIEKYYIHTVDLNGSSVYYSSLRLDPVWSLEPTWAWTQGCDSQITAHRVYTHVCT